MTRTLLAVAAAVLAAVALSPTAAVAATRKTCSGTVTFSGTPTKVVLYRGVSCRRAKEVLRAYDKGTAPGRWQCALAHAPFTKVGGRIVGVSCGAGSGSGDLRSRRHAFVGTVRSPS